MHNNYEKTLSLLRAKPKKWLVTGVAGFIGSNILENLLVNGQQVVGVDNFATGRQCNLDEVRILVGANWEKFKFIEGDIRDLNTCRHACKGVNYVLHQAALGSVPRSLHDPIMTNSTNVDGFLNMLVAALDEKSIENFVYAASSSTYGDHPDLPKRENFIGKPLSPYAVTKYVNELYAGVFSRAYNFRSIGLRYFNVFGPRQNPDGAYAAVIPKWISNLLNNEPIFINGPGDTSRDFCFVENAVQANIQAATSINANGSEIYNIAVGDRTSLNDLIQLMRDILVDEGVESSSILERGPYRAGDVLHSQADISKAKSHINYSPHYNIKEGLKKSIKWYLVKQHSGV